MSAAALALAPRVGMATACRALGLSRATVYRHRKQPVGTVSGPRPTPPRALAPQEREQVLATLHEERFVDRAPATVYAMLLEEGRYLCSIRTMYRFLAEAAEVVERRWQRRHPHYEAPHLVATAPNQTWTWDITRLPGPCKWTSYALYVVLDLFSRYVVAWMVARRETAALAKRLITSACQKQGIQPGQITLHQDRGAPMKAKTFTQLLVDLDILASYSRPRVSDDNPYSESHFKTLKYAPTYPGRFGGPTQARQYCQVFFPFYNTQHRHSGLGLLTPEAVHYGHAEQIQHVRQGALDAAYVAHPNRFVGGPPKAPQVPTEVWINRPEKTLEWNPTGQ